MKKPWFFILFIFIFLSAFISSCRLVWWKISITKNIIPESYTWENKIDRDFQISPTYDNKEDNNLNFWMIFVSILSTLLAVFFVYSWFKIEETKGKLNELIEKTDKKIDSLINAWKNDLKEMQEGLEQAINRNIFWENINEINETIRNWDYKNAKKQLEDLLQKQYIKDNNTMTASCYHNLWDIYRYLANENNNETEKIEYYETSLDYYNKSIELDDVDKIKFNKHTNKH